MADHISVRDRDDAGGIKWTVAPSTRVRRRGLRARGARLFATCAMGAWVLLAVTPVVVVLCAIG